MTKHVTATLSEMEPRLSEDEFLKRERLADEKHELLNGKMIAMAGASPRHVKLSTNLLIALGSRLRGCACAAYGSDLRVHIPATGLYTYPDLTVICGPITRHEKDAATVLNPTVIVEVLSESTEAYDRGAKFGHYRSIGVLRSYVLVDQREPHIERYDRMDDGDWRLHDVDGLGLELALPCIGVTVPLAEVYENLPPE